MQVMQEMKFAVDAGSLVRDAKSAVSVSGVETGSFLNITHWWRLRL